MKLLHVRRRIVAVTAIAAAIVLVGAGVAVAATTSKSGTSVTRVAVLTQDSAVEYSSTAWTFVAAQPIYATAGSFILATFSAESVCTGTGWCSARILVDGVEASPAVGTDFAFDSSGNNTENALTWESHSFQRTATVAVSGGHTVTLQVASYGVATLRIDDWTLTSIAVTP